MDWDRPTSDQTQRDHEWRRGSPLFGRLAVLTCLSLIMALLAACSSGSELEIETPENTYSFDQTELMAPRDTEVTVRYTNHDRRRHDLVIVRDVFDSEDAAREAIETDPDIVVGATDSLRQAESEILTVTFDEPGTYQFFCRRFGHFGAGMRGTITVEG